MAVGAGESIGLIGPNGSGKTTMLRLLAKVMYPYAGRVAVGGRVGALIDVRAGIHPDLTGAENVYLYGSLLGVSRREVARKFDEIVAFGELETAIDRQVKFYSSGMHVRLGFAIAAFTEPDVLLVDEVLAVGDAAFQQNASTACGPCWPRAPPWCSSPRPPGGRVDLRAGRLAARRRGRVRRPGARRARRLPAHGRAGGRDPHPGLRVGAGGQVRDPRPRRRHPGEPAAAGGQAAAGEPRTDLGQHEHRRQRGPATPIFLLGHEAMLPAGQTELRCAIPFLPLPRGRFYLWFGIIESTRDLVPWHPVSQFEVLGPELTPTPRGILRMAPVQVTPTWEVEER